MVRQARLIAITGVFLIACAVALVVVGCAGVRSGAPPEEDQGHIQATKEGHEHTEATPSEEARCEDTRTFHVWYVVYPNGQNSSLQSGSAEDMKKAGKKAGKVEEGGLLPPTTYPAAPRVACS